MDPFEVAVCRIFATWAENARRDGMQAPRIAALAAMLAAITDPIGVTDEELDVAIMALLSYRKAEHSRLTGGN